MQSPLLDIAGVVTQNIDNLHQQAGSSTVIEWKAGERSATARVLEINDYFRLLERGAVTNEITYFYDHEGRIDGLLIRAVGERPPGRTNEFLRWALENEPEELRELMPNGRIDPSGDHPQRFRALLERWRDDVGLPALSSSRGSAVSQEDSRTVEDVEPALRRLSERFVRGWRENDPEAVMSTLATNAVILPHHGVHPKEGMEEIRAFWFPEDGPAARVVKFGQTYDEIAGTEEIAYARGRFELSFEWNGTIYSNEGNYLMLFGRGEDGEWKITHRIWNDPIPEER